MEDLKKANNSIVVNSFTVILKEEKRELKVFQCNDWPFADSWGKDIRLIEVLDRTRVASLFFDIGLSKEDKKDVYQYLLKRPYCRIEKCSGEKIYCILECEEEIFKNDFDKYYYPQKEAGNYRREYLPPDLLIKDVKADFTELREEKENNYVLCKYLFSEYDKKMQLNQVRQVWWEKNDKMISDERERMKKRKLRGSYYHKDAFIFNATIIQIVRTKEDNVNECYLKIELDTEDDERIYVRKNEYYRFPKLLKINIREFLVSGDEENQRSKKHWLRKDMMDKAEMLEGQRVEIHIEAYKVRKSGKSFIIEYYSKIPEVSLKGKCLDGWGNVPVEKLSAEEKKEVRVFSV